MGCCSNYVLLKNRNKYDTLSDQKGIYKGTNGHETLNNIQTYNLSSLPL